jgi:ISXO2-like transposase domain
VTTNTVEGFYSIFKRGMKGVYQHCAEKHLHHRYLSEFDFRYSNRVALGIHDGQRADLAIKGAAGKRLTIVKLTEPNFKRLARRFLRWRAKQPKPKPKFVKDWRTR